MTTRHLAALTALAFVTAALSGCGKEIGRVPLSGDGSGTASLQVKAGKKLAIWTSLDVSYTGAFGATYDVELVQDGVVVGKTTCDALHGVNVKTGSKELHLGDSHTVKYNGKMSCELAAPKAGPATLRARLRLSPKPPGLVVNDASLIVKE